MKRSNLGFFDWLITLTTHPPFITLRSTPKEALTAWATQVDPGWLFCTSFSGNVFYSLFPGCMSKKYIYMIWLCYDVLIAWWRIHNLAISKHYLQILSIRHHQEPQLSKSILNHAKALLALIDDWCRHDSPSEPTATICPQQPRLANHKSGGWLWFITVSNGLILQWGMIAKYYLQISVVSQIRTKTLNNDSMGFLAKRS